MTAPAPRRPQKIGIFRASAVRRYAQPLEVDTPDMLAPHRHRLLAVAVVLACAAVLALALT